MSSAELSKQLDGHVACLHLRRPPNNYLDAMLLAQLADELERCDASADCRAVVLAAEGKHFCAGVDFGSRSEDSLQDDEGRARDLYRQALRVFRTGKPIIAALQGACVGGGLGLALAADLRVGGPASSFTANFVRLGFHQGFGLSLTLPRLVGRGAASRMLLTGARVKGIEAHRIGLIDVLVDDEQIFGAALDLAREVAAAAPLAVQSVRATLRSDLLPALERTLEMETAEQSRLRATRDFLEGVRAIREKRPPVFKGE